MSAEETLLPLVYTPSSPAPANSPTSPDQSDAYKYSPSPSHWPSRNFILAAGTATFQPSTAKVVLVEDVSRRRPNTPREEWYWFLPRGRKDRGETLEQCAVRETLEEVNIKSSLCLFFLLTFVHINQAGYAATLMRSPMPTLQPKGAGNETTHIEAFHIQLLPRLRRRFQTPIDITSVEVYLAFWYLCTIPYDAVRDKDYGTRFVGAHEKAYCSELVDIAEAVKLLSYGNFEYQYTGTESDNRMQGILVDKRTKHIIHWEDVRGDDPGGIEALIVALGWEWVSAVSGSVEMVRRFEV